MGPQLSHFTPHIASLLTGHLCDVIMGHIIFTELPINSAGRKVTMVAAVLGLLDDLFDVIMGHTI